MIDFPEDDIPEEIRHEVAKQNRHAARSGESIDMVAGPSMADFRQVFGSVPGEAKGMA